MLSFILMDHLEVLRAKIALLRAEIAELKGKNEQYRRDPGQDLQAQFAHGQRHERLQEIQQELTQLANLGGRRSVDQAKEQHRSRPYLIHKAS
jgi:FtsZ-binding cell division protein ZapB